MVVCACSVAATCRYAADLVVHMGYDAWHQNEKLVLPLQQLPPDEACPRYCTKHAVEPSDNNALAST